MGAPFRHELKFFLSPLQYLEMRHRLRHLLRRDPHGDLRGEYRITSLYFDDVADSALFEKLSGVQHRSKLRVRIYDGREQVIMLEKKVKHGEGVHKERLQITRPLYYLYVENGRFTILPWDLNMSFGGFGMGGGTQSQVTVKID